MRDTPVSVYGPTAHSLHGIDAAISGDSLQRVADTTARFIVARCGVEPIVDRTQAVEPNSSTTN